jgi:hypothetical protein
VYDCERHPLIVAAKNEILDCVVTPQQKAEMLDRWDAFMHPDNIDVVICGFCGISDDVVIGPNDSTESRYSTTSPSSR